MAEFKSIEEDSEMMIRDITTMLAQLVEKTTDGSALETAVAGGANLIRVKS
jgi:hypothetical protein